MVNRQEFLFCYCKGERYDYYNKLCHLRSKRGYRIVNYDTPVCPYCGGSLKVKDYRKRKVIELSGTETTYFLRRLYCQDCNKYHVEVPDFIAAHKHYSKSVIESVLDGSCISCPADNSTIFRWQK